MAKYRRDLLLILLVPVLALFSFGAGFISRDLEPIERLIRNGGSNEDLGIFWEAWQKAEESFIGELPDSQGLTYGAIRGAYAELNDPYSFFVEPEEHQRETQEHRGNFGGIGAFVTQDEDGRIILSPIPDGPAEAAGVIDGDILSAVDGISITSQMTLENVFDLIRGEVGTDVEIAVIRTGTEETKIITITRATVVQPSLSYRVLDLDDSIGYIQLRGFTGESGGEVRDALNDLKASGTDKLILDLRQNGGGLLSAAIEVADHFLVGGPILYQVSKGEDEKVFSASTETLAPDIQLVVLVDGFSASASEIVAGALQDRGRAKIVGMPTFGKGSVQAIFGLSDGSAVHVTSARWLTPNRHQLDQQGLIPDLEVEFSHETTGTAEDAALLAAINLFSAEAGN